MTTLDAEQTAALYRAANRRELGEYVAELLGEAVAAERAYGAECYRREHERACAAERDRDAWQEDSRGWRRVAVEQTRMERERAEAAERELAEARATDAVLRGEIRRNESALATFDDVVADRDEARRRLAVAESAYMFAQQRAIGAHARGDGQAERQWLDLLHLLDRAALTPDADA